MARLMCGWSATWPRARRCRSTTPGCTPASTTRPSPCSAACCPATSPRCPGSTSPTATSRPAGPGGQAALVVGDVTGHSIHAAAIMGQLRTTAAALARLGHPPGEIMGQLAGVVAAHGDEAGATCLYAVYDPRSRRCRLTSAGHPPPALRHPGGTTEFLDLPSGVMLGAGPGRYPAADIGLPAGSVLALYTDGLVEQPGQDIGAGMSRLARALAASPARSLDDLCDSVLASLAPPARDDIALLLARPVSHASRAA